MAAGKPDGASDLLWQALDLWADADPDPGAVVEAGGAAWARWLTAAEDLYDAELQLGRTTATVADLTQAVEASPLRERLRGLLAMASYRSRRQADALAMLDEGRRLLDEESAWNPARSGATYATGSSTRSQVWNCRGSLRFLRPGCRALHRSQPPVRMRCRQPTRRPARRPRASRPVLPQPKVGDTASAGD